MRLVEIPVPKLMLFWVVTFPSTLPVLFDIALGEILPWVHGKTVQKEHRQTGADPGRFDVLAGASLSDERLHPVIRVGSREGVPPKDVPWIDRHSSDVSGNGRDVGPFPDFMMRDESKEPDFWIALNDPKGDIEPVGTDDQVVVDFHQEGGR